MENFRQIALYNPINFYFLFDNKNIFNNYLRLLTSAGHWAPVKPMGVLMFKLFSEAAVTMTLMTALFIVLA